MIKTLDTITEDHKESVGGKAYSLAFMHQRGIFVPPAIVLSEIPTAEEWQGIKKWWNNLGEISLAARSSAVGEDSEDFSFAGQFISILDIQNFSELENAVVTCFNSLKRKSGQAYQEFFSHKAPKMNVVIQQMVEPQFSGVFFSMDPTKQEDNSQWVVEMVEGVGETLVSGQVTPYYFSKKSYPEDLPHKFKKKYLEEILKQGEKVRAYYDFHIDMEWSIDMQGNLWILQARPVTARNSQSSHKQIIDWELKRLKNSYSEENIWDGQTFAEWTGVPSELTFSVWQKAFAADGAYGAALKEIGYAGFRDGEDKESLLERVFGRAYLNLSLLEPLYFGEIPFNIVADPRPHLKFSWKKLTLKSLFLAPLSFFRMLRVGWRVQSYRKDYIDKAEKALIQFEEKELKYSYAPEQYEKWTSDQLLKEINDAESLFTQKALKWPFVLIILIESTTQGLEKFLKKSFGENGSKQMLNEWMSHGLHTETMAMYDIFNESELTKDKVFNFYSAYGHRATGELELSHPRWIELSDTLFKKDKKNKKYISKKVFDENYIYDKIKEAPLLYRQVLKEEWEILRSLLELRETWKMQIMKPYARLRWYVLELGRRLNLNNEVFWYSLDEISNMIFDDINVLERKQKSKIFSHINFPTVVSLEQIEKSLKGEFNHSQKIMEGVGISPGMVYGEIKVIKDPQKEMDEDWPENIIIVAEATDPGWTPLFQKAKGIIVSKGGVLSHCAIVAREMALPAVSGVNNCSHIFKDGQKVWLDGSHGRISVD